MCAVVLNTKSDCCRLDDNENKDDLVEISNNSEADAGAVWPEESEEENPADGLLHES